MLSNWLIEHLCANKREMAFVVTTFTKTIKENRFVRLIIVENPLDST